MQHTQEEIVNALKVIQDTCKNMKGAYACEKCPFGKNNECVLQEQAPVDWTIKPNHSIWKAFE